MKKKKLLITAFPFFPVIYKFKKQLKKKILNLMF